MSGDYLGGRAARRRAGAQLIQRQMSASGREQPIERSAQSQPAVVRLQIEYASAVIPPRPLKDFK